MGIPVTSAEDAVREVDSAAVREDVNEFGRDVRVHRRGCREKLKSYRAGDFEVVIEWGRGVDKNVIPLFDGSLITWTRRKMISITAQRTADSGDRLVWRVNEFVGRFDPRYQR